MLEFNAAGRLINLVAGTTQTQAQIKLLPHIECLLSLAYVSGNTTITTKLRNILTEYNYNNEYDLYDLIYLYQTRKPHKEEWVVDGKIVYTKPDEKTHFKCEYCNEWHSLENTDKHKTDDGYEVCDRVWNEECVTCVDCGKKYLRIWNSGQKLCKKCNDEREKYRIKRYHDNPELKFYNEQGETSETRGAFYGIELEVDRGGESNDMSKDVIKLMQERVYTMHDGSLTNGFEIITHPHTEQAIKNLNWEETFKWLIHKGYRSHDINTCGLHLHINRSIFNNDESIIKMMYFYDKFYDEVLKVSRREKSKAQRWAGTYAYDYKNITLNYCRDVFGDVDDANDHDMRYKCVNLQKRNTIEIRIMRGTLNYASFMACLDFMMTVAKNSNKVVDIDNINEWLDGINDNTKQYLCARRAFGYPPEEQEVEDDCYYMTSEEINKMEERVCAL